MTAYYIYQPPETGDPAEAVVVADGFSWLALITPTFWSIRSKLWELVVVNIILSFVITALVPPEMAAVILVVWHAIFGIMAGNIHAHFMTWRAYRLMDYIPDAQNDDAAFTQWVYTR